MTSRRNFLKTSGALGGVLGTGMVGAAAARTPPATAAQRAQLDRLQGQIEAMEVDDSHCHPISQKDAQTTPDDFLERLALAAFPLPSYFPEGVYARWRKADGAGRAALDRQYGIARIRDNVLRQFESSVFVKYMLKEMAGFLGCKPRLAEVIEARNARGQDYDGYIGALLRDIRLGNAMLDTGFGDGLDAAGMQRFADAIQPARTRHLARVETLADDLMARDIGYAELRDSFVRRVTDALDGTGNFGQRSYGMKSYLLPDIGLIVPVYEDAPAAASWDEYKRTRDRTYTDRAEANQRGKVLRERLLTLAMEACLVRDMPMQFHAGDGEAPYVTLRNQHPYYLEEFARFDKDGVMRMPKVIPIHAGYPLVGEAAWLSHLYTNVYFETSLMTPFIHRGLLERYLQIMEAVPLSKILFGSDAYNLPELYWLAGRWGKRYLAQALAVYVREGILDEEEALQAARMVLHLNNRAVYNLRD